MKLFKKGLKFFFSLAVLLIIIQFLNPFTFSAGAFEFETSIKVFGSGKTRIHFPRWETLQHQRIKGLSIYVFH
jgi:hypothetical protein